MYNFCCIKTFGLDSLHKCTKISSKISSQKPSQLLVKINIHHIHVYNTLVQKPSNYFTHIHGFIPDYHKNNGRALDGIIHCMQAQYILSQFVAHFHIEAFQQ